MTPVKAGPRLFTIPETADRLRLHRSSVYRLITAGDLAVTDEAPTGSRKSKSRISEEELARHIKSRTRLARTPRDTAA